MDISCPPCAQHVAGSWYYVDLSYTVRPNLQPRPVNVSWTTWAAGLSLEVRRYSKKRNQTVTSENVGAN